MQAVLNGAKRERGYDCGISFRPLDPRECPSPTFDTQLTRTERPHRPLTSIYHNLNSMAATRASKRGAGARSAQADVQKANKTKKSTAERDAGARPAVKKTDAKAPTRSGKKEKTGVKEQKNEDVQNQDQNQPLQSNEIEQQTIAQEDEENIKVLGNSGKVKAISDEEDNHAKTTKSRKSRGSIESKKMTGERRSLRSAKTFPILDEKEGETKKEEVETSVPRRRSSSRQRTSKGKEKEHIYVREVTSTTNEVETENKSDLEVQNEGYSKSSPDGNKLVIAGRKRRSSSRVSAPAKIVSDENKSVSAKQDGEHGESTESPRKRRASSSSFAGRGRVTRRSSRTSEDVSESKSVTSSDSSVSDMQTDRPLTSTTIGSLPKQHTASLNDVTSSAQSASLSDIDSDLVHGKRKIRAGSIRKSRGSLSTLDLETPDTKSAGATIPPRRSSRRLRLPSSASSASSLKEPEQPNIDNTNEEKTDSPRESKALQKNAGKKDTRKSAAETVQPSPSLDMDKRTNSHKSSKKVTSTIRKTGGVKGKKTAASRHQKGANKPHKTSKSANSNEDPGFSLFTPAQQAELLKLRSYYEDVDHTSLHIA